MHVHMRVAVGMRVRVPVGIVNKHDLSHLLPFINAFPFYLCLRACVPFTVLSITWEVLKQLNALGYLSVTFTHVPLLGSLKICLTHEPQNRVYLLSLSVLSGKFPDL